MSAFSSSKWAFFPSRAETAWWAVSGMVFAIAILLGVTLGGAGATSSGPGSIRTADRAAAVELP